MSSVVFITLGLCAVTQIFVTFVTLHGVHWYELHLGEVYDLCVISRDTMLITPNRIISQFTSAAVIARTSDTSLFLLIC